jgi:DNA-binding transcriptional regulator YdaS (Cro superfamily)
MSSINNDIALTHIQRHRGTAAHIARELGITRSAVNKWSRVPAERVIAVEKILRMPRHLIRPDIYPPREETAQWRQSSVKVPTAASAASRIDRYLGEIDKADDKLLHLKSEHMTACKGPHEHIRNIMKEARESGVNMAALRTIVASHRAARDRTAHRRTRGRHRDELETMQEALGAFSETELGQAALGKVKNRRQRARLDTLRADQLGRSWTRVVVSTNENELHSFFAADGHSELSGFAAR